MARRAWIDVVVLVSGWVLAMTERGRTNGKVVTVEERLAHF